MCFPCSTTTLRRTASGAATPPSPQPPAAETAEMAATGTEARRRRRTGPSRLPTGRRQEVIQLRGSFRKDVRTLGGSVNQHYRLFPNVDKGGRGCIIPKLLWPSFMHDLFLYPPFDLYIMQSRFRSAYENSTNPCVPLPVLETFILLSSGEEEIKGNRSERDGGSKCQMTK